MIKKLDNLISRLTLEEKAAICSGIGFWETTPISRVGIPSVMMTDGPHGVRRELEKTVFGNIFQPSQSATCFTPAVTVASSWSREVAEEVGNAIGEECLDQGVSTILGPGINIKRNPLCGRNFEYFSEDPYLSGEMAIGYINGVQKNNIGTSLKHFAVNNQEYRRLVNSSEVDERAFREIYLAGFEAAVKKAQPYTVMCSYNPINGVYASDNKKLLWDILREEWGFRGIVVSDWGAVNDRVKGIVAGMDLGALQIPQRKLPRPCLHRPGCPRTGHPRSGAHHPLPPPGERGGLHPSQRTNRTLGCPGNLLPHPTRPGARARLYTYPRRNLRIAPTSRPPAQTPVDYLIYR